LRGGGASRYGKGVVPQQRRGDSLKKKLSNWVLWEEDHRKLKKVRGTRRSKERER